MSEFIGGSPSPLNFLLAGRFVTKVRGRREGACRVDMLLHALGYWVACIGLLEPIYMCSTGQQQGRIHFAFCTHFSQEINTFIPEDEHVYRQRLMRLSPALNTLDYAM